MVSFIDRQLTQNTAYLGRRYETGPFMPNAPANLGDQSALTVRDRFGMGVVWMDAYALTKCQQNVKDLMPAQQDQVPRDMEAGTATGSTGVTAQAFIALLRLYTFAGFLADPMHGGNRNLVGWHFIGLPGVQNYQQAISRDGEPFTQALPPLSDNALTPRSGTKVAAGRSEEPGGTL